MDKQKLIDILDSSKVVGETSEELAQRILDYNNSIVYRRYDLDRNNNKWVLKECH